MMRLVLHIGQGKAGSTAIQHAFSGNRAQLLRGGILYPETRYITHCHHFLSPLHFDHPERWPSVIAWMGFSVERARELAREEWDNCKKQITTTGASAVVLSSEALFSAYNPREVERARPGIGSLDVDMRILAYLRSPVSRYLSFVQQKLKGARVLIPPAASAVIDVLRTNELAFGRKVEVRKFSSAHLKNSDVVQDFVEWAGIHDIGIRWTSPEQNTSLSPEAMKVLADLGGETQPKGAEALSRQRRLRSLVLREDERLEGAGKPRLKPNVAEYLNRVNADLIPLRDEYGIHYDDIDYSVVGKSKGLQRPTVERVEDLCDVDRERFLLLKERVQQELRRTPSATRKVGWTRMMRVFRSYTRG